MNRDTIAVRFAALWEKTIVLKGAATVIAAPDGRFTIIPVATSALATAGTGDVLAGMITGLIAQGLDPYSASIAAAWLHAQAGLLASKEFGQPASVVAGDVIRHIPAALKKAAGIL
jgi:NAD(P)H-hydrate epimerase